MIANCSVDSRSGKWTRVTPIPLLSFWLPSAMLLTEFSYFHKYSNPSHSLAVLQQYNVLWLVLGAFNLHLLEFTFIYQFYSRKTILVESMFWNPVGLFAFMSFHNHFKLFWYCVLLKMRGIFCPYLFWDAANWHLNW